MKKRDLNWTNETNDWIPVRIAEGVKGKYRARCMTEDGKPDYGWPQWHLEYRAEGAVISGLFTELAELLKCAELIEKGAE